jgi:hypothetical protein
MWRASALHASSAPVHDPPQLSTAAANTFDLSIQGHVGRIAVLLDWDFAVGLGGCHRHSCFRSAMMWPGVGDVRRAERDQDDQERPR